ncbi:hypothetical protein EDB83DRAFT_2425514, partial [Lactarius deliciosus]
MLYGLPAEVMLNVLSYLPIPSLLSLPVLSRQWLDFFTANQSTIFRSAALLHEYIQPKTSLLEDALSVNTGRPWAGSKSWKDFCKSMPTTNCTSLVMFFVKAADRFNYAKTGRERGTLSRVHFRLRV